MDTIVWSDNRQKICSRTKMYSHIMEYLQAWNPHWAKNPPVASDIMYQLLQKCRWVLDKDRAATLTLSGQPPSSQGITPIARSKHPPARPVPTPEAACRPPSVALSARGSVMTQAATPMHCNPPAHSLDSPTLQVMRLVQSWVLSQLGRQKVLDPGLLLIQNA